MPAELANDPLVEMGRLDETSSLTFTYTDPPHDLVCIPPPLGILSGSISRTKLVTTLSEYQLSTNLNAQILLAQAPLAVANNLDRCIYWPKMKGNVDGICIVSYTTGFGTAHKNWLVEIDKLERGESTASEVAAKKVLVDATITIHLNNFSSDELIYAAKAQPGAGPFWRISQTLA